MQDVATNIPAEVYLARELTAPLGVVHEPYFERSDPW